MQSKNPYKKDGLFGGALHTVFEKAKQLRNTMTYAEEVLWLHLKGGIEGCKFRRQHPVANYIADFYCHKAKLVIEVDGSVHKLEDVKKRDEEKELFLVNSGHSFLRFTNQQVLTNIETVLQTITTVVQLNIRKHTPNSGV
jgi:imidazole glycerol-phosphate synthase subunit HisF